MQLETAQTPYACGFESILVKNKKRQEKLWELAILETINPLARHAGKGIK